MSTGWLITLGLVLGYLAFVVWLHRTGRMERYNLSLLLGVILMIRTKRGRKLVEAVARPRRLWNIFGDFSIVLAFVAMAGMTIPVFAAVPRLLRPDSGVPAFGASEILLIPGVNPFVPLWYGIAALIVTLVVHEGGHGVLAIANKIRLRTMGLLFAVVPVGAFVEPEEEDMVATSRRNRLRVFAAGASVNIVLAGVLLLVLALLVGAASPMPGAAILGVNDPGPAYSGGVRGGDLVVLADGEPIADWAALTTFLRGQAPGNDIVFTLHDGREHVVTLGSRWAGLDPALQREIMDAKLPEGHPYCDAFVGKGEYASGAECAERLLQMPFLGVRPVSPVVGNATAYDALSHPFGNRGANLAFLAYLPIYEIRDAPWLSSILPAFHETPFHAPTFWVLTSLVFWIFWVNLLVGLTNFLPIAIFDGGHLFREGVAGIMATLRPGMPAERRDRVVGGIARVTTVVVLVAFLIMILGPWLAQAGWLGPG